MTECDNYHYLKHKPSGNYGIFIKEYYATGHGYIYQIGLNDGRIYYAPSSEFQVCKTLSNMRDFKPLEKYAFHFDKKIICGIFYFRYMNMPEISQPFGEVKEIPFEKTKIKIQELHDIFVLDDGTQVYIKDINQTVHPTYGKLMKITDF